jgi:hypothetical protein
MPVRHHKEEFKNTAIMWLRQEAIKYRNCALFPKGEASFIVRYDLSHLKEVLQVSSG